MTPTEQKTAAKKFVVRWQQAEGNEPREANSFWIELCSQVLGIANPTQRLDFERKVKGRRGPDMAVRGAAWDALTGAVARSGMRQRWRTQACESPMPPALDGGPRACGRAG